MLYLPERLLDTDHTPAATAIRGLFDVIKNDVEGYDGQRNGGDVVDLLNEWFTALGFDVDEPPTNAPRTDRTHTPANAP